MTETTRLFDGTTQGLFDTVTRHLFAQGRPALQNDPHMRRSANGCMYRGPNGTKCAAGVLIPDDLYDDDMENRPASTFMILQAIGISAGSDEQIGLLGELQRVHDTELVREFDGTFNRDRLATRLRSVAASFALNTDAIPA
jgi:hypothetical protein